MRISDWSSDVCSSDLRTGNTSRAPPPCFAWPPSPKGGGSAMATPHPKADFRRLIRRRRERPADRTRAAQIFHPRQRIGRRQLEGRRHRRRCAQPVGEEQPARPELVENHRQQLLAEDEAAFAAPEFALRRSEEHPSELQSPMRISYAV